MDQLCSTTMTYSKEVIWGSNNKNTKSIWSSTYLKISSKRSLETSRLGWRCARQTWWGAAREKAKRTKVFCCQVLFSSFQKNKNGQEILPIWYSHHRHVRWNARPSLPVASSFHSERGWSRTMPTSDLTGMPQIEIKLWVSSARDWLYCLDSMQLPISV